MVLPDQQLISAASKSVLGLVMEAQSPSEALGSALPILGQQLNCDRIFLYLRHPELKRGRVPFCWCDRADVPPIYDADWKEEPASLADDDPMFAAALKAEPSIFVADVEMASPSTLNREFEAKTFGHRALVHAHLCRDRQLWGILQPEVFDHPRRWRSSDRHLIQQAVYLLTPLAVEYVTQAICSK